jgi:hypothetical protein
MTPAASGAYSAPSPEATYSAIASTCGDEWAGYCRARVDGFSAAGSFSAGDVPSEWLSKLSDFWPMLAPADAEQAFAERRTREEVGPEAAARGAAHAAKAYESGEVRWAGAPSADNVNVPRGGGGAELYHMAGGVLDVPKEEAARQAALVMAEAAAQRYEAAELRFDESWVALVTGEPTSGGAPPRSPLGPPKRRASREELPSPRHSSRPEGQASSHLLGGTVDVAKEEALRGAAVERALAVARAYEAADGGDGPRLIDWAKAAEKERLEQERLETERLEAERREEERREEERREEERREEEQRKRLEEERREKEQAEQERVAAEAAAAEEAAAVDVAAPGEGSGGRRWSDGERRRGPCDGHEPTAGQ